MLTSVGAVYMNGTVVHGAALTSNSPKAPPKPPRSSEKSLAALTPAGPSGCAMHIAVGDDSELVGGDDNSLILSGSLKALIRKLLPRKDYLPETSFIFSFLLNARLFVAPAELLHQILQYCIFEQNSTTDNFKKDSAVRFYWNIIRLVREWTEAFPYDFLASDAMSLLEELLNLCGSVDPALKQHASLLQQSLTSKLNKLERYEAALTNIKNQITHKAVVSDNCQALCDVTGSALAVAQQLTHIELERLSMIGPEEFVHTFARDHVRDFAALPAKTRRTRNIEHYADWFNQLSFLVATEVCKHTKKRRRVRTIEFFIDVAKECFNIGNLNSTMAIVAAFNLNPVARLKRTWNAANTQQLEILQHQLDPSGNFGSYRATLKAAMWRSAGGMHKREKIVVPFFSLFVKDLLFLHEGCSERLPNGHINFKKFHTFAAAMEDFMHWKQAECPFDRDTAVLQHLLTSAVFSEPTLEVASFECEPPTNTAEKELLKKMKIDVQIQGGR